MKNNRNRASVEATYGLTTEEMDMAKKLGMNRRMLVRRAQHPVQGKTFPDFIRHLYEKRLKEDL